MTDHIAEFIDAMRASGIAPSKPGIVTDGKIHRYHVAGDRAGKKNGWYVFFSGDIPAGAFGSWKTGDQATWCAKSDHELNEVERQENRRKMDEARQAREKAEIVIRQAACDKANILWNRAADSVSADHPYVVAKGIRPAGARQLRDMLVLPLHDIDGHLHSLQFIGKDGSKRFLTGGRKAGCFTVLEGDENGYIFCVTEGWATGCSILQATGKTTVVCFDAGNLTPVCASLRKKYPDAKIIVCADDDFKTAGNPGLTKAKEAAGSIGGYLAKPVFGDDRLEDATDFNDLHASCVGGLKSVRQCINDAVLIQSDKSDKTNKHHSENPQDKPKNKNINWNKVSNLVKRYVLIYGTDTCFDLSERMIVKVNHLRLAAGNDYVKLWLNSRDRKMITPSQLVFDPSCKCKEPEVNLFRGFDIEAKRGDFSPIMDLLHHLCADSAESDQGIEDVVNWVLCWLAYPLQRPGAKMRSALVFHGPQGTGKNMFFEIVASIYGQYALVVGQDQLEDKFNDWASQKLFLIGDEVVARQELYHQKNKLKSFVTGESIQINTKMMPLRTERNHVNVVFLSNEDQPLAIEPSDRRYFVVYTPPSRVDDLYKRVSDCLNNGGREAFYHYLMNFDVGDFDEFSKPIMTIAKRELIELGLRPGQRFAYEWIKGYLPLPLLGCSVDQLFRAFGYWAKRNGERWPPNQSAFTSSVKKSVEFISTRLGRDRPVIRYKKVRLGYVKNGQSSVRMWVPDGQGPSAEGETEGQWAVRSMEKFDDALKDFMESGDRV